MMHKTNELVPDVNEETESEEGQERRQSFIKAKAATPPPKPVRADPSPTPSTRPSVPLAAPVPRIAPPGRSVPPPPPSARGVGPTASRPPAPPRPPAQPHTTQSPAAEPLRAELEQTRRELARTQQELAGALAERDALKDRLAAQQSRLRVLEADRERCEALEMDSWEAAGHEAKARELTLRAEQAEAESARTAALLASREAELEELRKRFSEAQSASQGDDLTQLKGVGPKFARALRREGVTTFSQIAAWTDEDIAGVAKKIGTTPGRIRRDGWIERARELCSSAVSP